MHHKAVCVAPARTAALRGAEKHYANTKLDGSVLLPVYMDTLPE